MESTASPGERLSIATPKPNDGLQTEHSPLSPTAPIEHGSRAGATSSSRGGDQKHIPKPLRKNSQLQSRRPSLHKPLSPRPMTIFHPRPYEDIYAEQAYLSITLQAYTAKLSDLITKYSLTEEESVHGESRKCKRKARKELGVLRGQLIHAAGQEQAIFTRLGELYVEAKSRDTWNIAHRHRSRLPRRPSGQPSEDMMRRASKSSLNGATPEFIPAKDPLQNQGQGNRVPDSPNTSDDEYSRVESEMSGNTLCGLQLELTLRGRDNEETVRRRRPRSTSQDAQYSIVTKERRLSLPTRLDSTCPLWLIT